MVTVVDHHPVGADIQMSALRIARDDGVTRTDVSASVHGPVLWGREAVNVNIVTGQCVRENRWIFRCGHDRRYFPSEPVSHGKDQFTMAESHGDTHRGSQTVNARSPDVPQ